MKKFLAVLLAVAMMLSCIPMMASAATVPVWDLADGGTTRLKANVSGLVAGDIITFFVRAETIEGTSLYLRIEGQGKAVYADGSEVYSGKHITDKGVATDSDWYYIEAKATVAGTHDLFVDGVTNAWAQIADVKINGVAVSDDQITLATKNETAIEAPTITGTITPWPVPTATIDTASISLAESLAFKFYPSFEHVDDIEATSAQFVFADGTTKDVAFGYEVTGGGDDNTFARVNKYALVGGTSTYDDEMIAVLLGVNLVPGETISFDYKPLSYELDECEIRPCVGTSAQKNWRLYFEYGEDASLESDATKDLGYLPTDIANTDLGNGWYRLSFTVGAATTTGTSAGDTATTIASDKLWVRFYGKSVGKIDFALDNLTVGDSICTFPEGCVVSGQAAEKPSYTYKFDDSNDTFTFARKEGKFFSADVVGSTISTPCFVLEGITPQMINDEITCNVIYNDEVIGSKTTSVAAYLNSLAAEEPDYADLANQLLVYGGAAQVYTKYNTANLAAEYVAFDLASPAAPDLAGNSDAGSDYRVKSAALHYSDAVSVIFKLTLADTDCTVKINGEAADLTDLGNGVYSVSTGALKFSELKDAQTVSIEVGGNVVASVTYYGAASAAYKFGNDNNAYGHLVNALYGVATLAGALQ